MYDLIEQKLEVLSKEAQRGDGNAYHWFCQRFTGAVDVFVDTLPESQRHYAIQRAQALGYGDEDRCEGDCVHGIDPRCCPAGCGDWMDFEPYYEEHDDEDRVSVALPTPANILIQLHALECHLALLSFVEELRGLDHSFAFKHAEDILEMAWELESIFPEVLVRLPSGEIVHLDEITCLIDRKFKHASVEEGISHG